MPNSKRLVDALIRHQIYLEGVKSYSKKQFDNVLRELNDVVKDLLFGIEYDDLSLIGKMELNKFLAKLEKSQRVIYSRYTSNLEKLLMDFMKADVKISTAIFETVDNRTMKEAAKEENNSLFGTSPLSGSKKSNDKLLGIINAEPIPANGMLPRAFVAYFIARAAGELQNTIRKARANKWTVNQTRLAIVGTKLKRFKDGNFLRFKQWNASVVDTLFQHVSSIVQNGIASVFYSSYMWLSILDSNTTEICIGRASRVYKYGQGPLPPAHMNCRSKAIPVTGKIDKQYKTYYDWLKTQPIAFHNDLFGKAKAIQFRKGLLDRNEFLKFENSMTLTVDEFKTKQAMMLLNS